MRRRPRDRARPPCAPVCSAIDCGVLLSKYGSMRIALTPSALHQVDELERVRRRRRDARLRLDVVDDVEAEVPAKFGQELWYVTIFAPLNGAICASQRLFASLMRSLNASRR